MPKEQYTLSVCAIFQNEASWLKEWIEFHKIVGVEHFFLFSHFSEDNYSEVLAPYVTSGEVDLIEWTEDVNEGKLTQQQAAQRAAYTYCLDEHGHRSRWIAFIDIDEFLFPVEEESLVETLRDYEEFGGLVVSYQHFGTSDVDRLGEGELLIERLTRCATPYNWKNNWVKSIVRPAVTQQTLSAHRFEHAYPFESVDSDKEPVHADQNPRIPLDRIRVNHYFARTNDWCYGEKLQRMRRPSRDADGRVLSYRKSVKEAVAWLDEHTAISSEYQDLTIQRFVPLLRERMGFIPYQLENENRGRVD